MWYEDDFNLGSRTGYKRRGESLIFECVEVGGKGDQCGCGGLAPDRDDRRLCSCSDRSPDRDNHKHKCEGCACKQLRDTQLGTPVAFLLKGSDVPVFGVFRGVDRKTCCVYLSEAFGIFDAQLDCKNISTLLTLPPSGGSAGLSQLQSAFPNIPINPTP